MKKLLSSLIVLLLLVGCCLIAAFPTSASDINYDDWDIIDGVVIEYIGEGGDVVVPSVDVDGNPITHIDSRAFKQNKDITSVVVSEGIETMGNEVFEYCENLTEASLPYSLTEMGYSMFRYANLYSITVPGNVKRVRHDFATCANLSEVVISSGVEEIEYSSFYGVFTKLVLPKSVLVAEGLFRGGMKHLTTEWDLYILNPSIVLGENNQKASSGFYDKYGPIGPLTYAYEGCKAVITIYGLEGSAIKDYVDNYMVGKVGTMTARFSGIDQDKIDELEEDNKAVSTPKPVVNNNNNNQNNNDGSGDGAVDGDGTVDGDGSGNNNGDGSNNNNTNNGTNNGGTNNGGTNNGGTTTTIYQQGGIDFQMLLIIGGAIILVIVIAIVVVIIVLSNSKNKKKKKKKAKIEAAQEAAVIDEVADVVTEEKGEEE